MPVINIHCPSCGGQLQVDVVVHRIIAPPQGKKEIIVDFAPARADHACPNTKADAVPPSDWLPTH